MPRHPDPVGKRLSDGHRDRKGQVLAVARSGGCLRPASRAVAHPGSGTLRSLMESARAATRGARGIGNSNPSRVARPDRALLPESARAATRGARGIGNSNPSRVARPDRALLPESARAATRGARGIGDSNTSRVARPVRALFPESERYRPPHFSRLVTGLVSGLSS